VLNIAEAEYSDAGDRYARFHATVGSTTRSTAHASPLANDRLERRADSRYVLRLKTSWRDGTTHLQFEPIELMERLAAQIPKPRFPGA
jgi:hypothetical protein